MTHHPDNPARFDLIIFDCDGVLVDSEAISNGILCAMINEQGLNYSIEQTTRQFRGRSMASCYRIIEQELGRPLPGDFDARFRERTFAAFTRDLKPIVGVAEVIRALHSSCHRLCVASSGPHDKIRLNLTTTGLLAYFDNHLFSSSDVARGKPAPDLFLFAAKTMQAKPERCAVIEDSPLGVQAAATAGMTVFGFAEETDPNELRAAGATVVFEHMSQLLDLLHTTPAAKR